MPEPTPLSLILTQGADWVAWCARCPRPGTVCPYDAVEMGYATTPLRRIPLRCRECGARASHSVMSGGWNAWRPGMPRA